MLSDSDVNPAFAAWRAAPDSQKEQCLQILIRRLEKFATAICWKRLPDHKDEFGPLVNEIVWRAIKKADDFQSESLFSTWFYRIISNECNRFLRRHIERAEVALDEDVPLFAPTMDARMDVISILNKLEGQDHTLLRLVAEGQDFKTIAKALGTNQMYAIVKWDRLKRRLRDAV